SGHETRPLAGHDDDPRGGLRAQQPTDGEHAEDPAHDPHAGAVAVLEEERPLDPVGRHGAEDDRLGQAQQAHGTNAEALPQARSDLRSHRAPHVTMAELPAGARPLVKPHAGQRGEEKAGRPSSHGHAMWRLPTYAPTRAVAMKPRLESWETREKRPCLGPSKPASSRASTPHASTAPLQKVVPTASIASATRNSA